MNKFEIRETAKAEESTLTRRISNGEEPKEYLFPILAEIAAQLAELNEKLASIIGNRATTADKVIETRSR